MTTTAWTLKSMILLEGERTAPAKTKEEWVLTTYGLRRSVYESMVSAALVQPEAEKWDPALVRTLLARKERRRAHRSAARLVGAQPAAPQGLPAPLRAPHRRRIDVTPIRFLAAATTGDFHLVARPSGVVHLHPGPLTPSCRFTSRGSTTVCRTRTRRLTVLDDAPLVVDLHTGARRVCGSCSAHLVATPSGWAEYHPRTLLAQRFAHMTDQQHAAWARLSTCEDDVLFLLLINSIRTGRHQGFEPDAAELARRAARAEQDRIAAGNVTALEQEAKADWWAQRAARIERLGFVRATSGRTTA